MGRLIDTDKLLEETRKDRDYAEKNGFLDMYYERQVLIDRIKSQPTAYDVDKVVEELEKLKNEKTMGSHKVMIKVSSMDVLEMRSTMNASEISKVIAEFLIENKGIIIEMIMENDTETLQYEIFNELTEI